MARGEGVARYVHVTLVWHMRVARAKDARATHGW